MTVSRSKSNKQVELQQVHLYDSCQSRVTGFPGIRTTRHNGVEGFEGVLGGRQPDGLIGEVPSDTGNSPYSKVIRHHLLNRSGGDVHVEKTLAVRTAIGDSYHD